MQRPGELALAKSIGILVKDGLGRSYHAPPLVFPHSCEILGFGPEI
jgi:hypothetical protein